MGVYPCTQGLYAHVMGTEPSTFKGARRPVESITICDAAIFCNKLSKWKGFEPCYMISDDFEEDPRWANIKWNPRANGYRLPTEAEWEYAAKANENLIFAGSNQLEDVGWFCKNSDGEPHPVGLKRPNAWGLYDMCGNIWEWVFDAHLRLYDNNQINPIWDEGSRLVRRGGSWYSSDHVSRISFRGRSADAQTYSYQGFRFVRNAPSVNRF